MGNSLYITNSFNKTQDLALYGFREVLDLGQKHRFEASHIMG